MNTPDAPQHPSTERGGLEQALQPFALRLRAMQRSTKIALAIGAVAVLALGFVMSKGGEVGPYSVLYTGLDARDAGEILAKLKEQRVSFRLEANGAAILVPEAQVHELRLDLAQQGLPKGGGVGFEIFDRPSYGQSDFVQQKNYLRALQGELERTIGALNAVQQARVHLVLPERRLFRNDGDAASASVVLKLRPGRALGEGQAQGIVHMVSSSVSGLAAERVTLLDDSGQVLSESGDGMGSFGAGSLDFRKKLERGYETKIRAILERAVGIGHASVQVAADVDFNQNERTEETYDAERPVLRSEQSNEETSSARAAQNEGIPGTRSNLPGAQPGPVLAAAPAAPASQPVGNSSQRRSQTRNFEIGKTTSRTVVTPGKLARLSVAVLVDGVYEGKVFQPRAPEQLEALLAVVRQAMGFDPRRGDQIELRCVPFAVEELPAADPHELPSLTSIAPLPVLMGGGAALVVLLMVAVFLLARRQRPSHLPAVVQTLPRTLREVEAMVDGGTLQPVQQSNALSPAHVQAMVMQDAGKAAAVVRSWLNPADKKAGAKA